MKIKQDPITGLWCRSDGAVLMPPTGCKRFKTFRWTFGSDHGNGYRNVQYKGKKYDVHRIICRAFHGLPPADKPQVDHINRLKDDNRPSNLHWVDNRENNNNKDYVDQALEKYGVRQCEDKKTYDAAYRAEKKAQGLSYRKGPSGKHGWFPCIRTKTAV